MKHESNKVFNLPSMLWTTYINLIEKLAKKINNFWYLMIQNLPKNQLFVVEFFKITEENCCLTKLQQFSSVIFKTLHACNFLDQKICRN
jgi:hypothetical protein